MSSSSNQFIWELAKKRPSFIIGTLFLTLSSAIFNGVGTALLIPILVVFLSEGEDYSLPDNPQILQKIFSIFDLFDGPEKLIIMLVSVVAIIVLKNITNYCNTWLGNYHTRSLVNALRLEGFDLLLNVGYDYYSKNKIGDITTYINREIERTIAVVKSGIKITTVGITVLTFIYFLLIISWQLTVISTLLLGLIAFCNKYFVKLSRRYGVLLAEKSRLYSRKSFEIVTGMRLIKLSANEPDEYQQIKELIKEREKIQLQSLTVSSAIAPVNEISGIIVILFLIVICRYFFTASIRDFAPTLLTYLVILFRLLPFVGQLNSARTQFANNYPSAEVVAKFLDRRSKPFLVPGEKVFRGLKKAITFENVSFSYPEHEKLVLNQVNLTIPLGKTVALVGSSGAGKSTMADLLPRFYDPTKGKILIDGVDLKEYDVRSFRQQMGVVSQDTYMFNNTVHYNIAYGLKNVSETAVISAIKQANAYEFIQNLPQGLNTEIGERGLMLSGGQRQRIAIARALLRNPQILILDEATSALDTVSERLVQEALEKLCAQRTTMVIAHRLSTVQNADCIVVMSEGKVLETGTHQELLSRGDTYSKLYNMQFTEDNSEGNNSPKKTVSEDFPQGQNVGLK